MEEEAGLFPLESIPEEVLSLIFSFLSPFDVIVLGQSSKLLHRISKDPFLWRHFCIHEFGLSLPAQDPSLPAARIRPPQGMTWRTLFRNCCNANFRFLNGIFSYYTVTSPSFSQHTQLLSSENEANSDRFRFYYPPSIRDSSLFVRVLVNYRRYRVEHWRTSEGDSPKKKQESVNTHQGVLPFNGGMDRVGFNTHNRAMELLPLSNQDFGFADEADNLCDALKIESFRPGLIFKNRTEFASLRGENRCDISWAEGPAGRKICRISACHNGEVIIWCLMGTLVRMGVATGRMQEISILPLLDQLLKDQRGKQQKTSNKKKRKDSLGDITSTKILWEGGRWVLCFLNDMWVVVWDLHAQLITLQHQNQQPPPQKEERAVEEEERDPARVVGVVVQEEPKRKKDEESNGEPAREGGGEGAATIDIPSGEGLSVPTPAAQETTDAPSSTGNNTTLATSTEASNHNTQQSHPATPTDEVKKLLLASKFLNAATRTTTTTKRKRMRGEETKGRRDDPTEVRCFDMPHSVKALSGDILAFGCRSGKVHVRDLSRPDHKGITLMAHARRKEKKQQQRGKPLFKVKKDRDADSVEAIWVDSKEVIAGAKGCLKAFSLNDLHEGKTRKKRRRTEPQQPQHPQHPQHHEEQEGEDMRHFYLDNESEVLKIVASASVVVARVLTGMWVCNRENSQRLYFLGHEERPRSSFDATRHFFWLDKGRIVRDQGKYVEVWDFMARERCVNEWLRDLHLRKDNKEYLTFPPDGKQDDEEELRVEDGEMKKEDERMKVDEEEKNALKRKRREKEERKEKRERKRERKVKDETREKRREEVKERKGKEMRERGEKRERKEREREQRGRKRDKRQRGGDRKEKRERGDRKRERRDRTR